MGRVFSKDGGAEHNGRPEQGHHRGGLSPSLEREQQPPREGDEQKQIKNGAAGGIVAQNIIAAPEKHACRRPKLPPQRAEQIAAIDGGVEDGDLTAATKQFP